MMKLFKYAAATVVAIMFATGSAMAYQGISIGVLGNTAQFDTSGAEKEGTGDKEQTNASISVDADFPSFFLEYSGGGIGGVEGIGFTFGVEHIPGSETIGTKSRTDATSDADEDSQDDGTYTAKADVSDYTAIYLEPTYMINETFGAYIKGSVSRLEVRSLESMDIGTDSSAYGNESVVGIGVGAGLKVVSPWGLFVKLEHMETDYETVTLNSTTGNRNSISADLEQVATRIAIGYNF